MDSNKKRIAIVIQRCSESIHGGSEVYALELAKALCAERVEVDVFSSCSDDYVHWNNKLEQEEKIRVDNHFVRVRRFPLVLFSSSWVFALYRKFLFFINKHFHFFYSHFSDFFDSLFIKYQGPWCPSLWKVLEENIEQYDLLVVKCYVYAPAYYSLKNLRKKIKTVFIVTAHPEPEFYLQYVKESIQNAVFLGFVSRAEKDLCYEIWPQAKEKAFLYLPPGLSKKISYGTIVNPLVEKIREKKYFLCLGRVDSKKNVEFIFSHTPSNCLVVFVGDLQRSIPKDPRFLYIGEVTPWEKQILLERALCLLMVSRYEAYSMVTAEAISLGCPVLALKGCHPVEELIEKYGGMIVEEDNFVSILEEIWQEKEGRGHILIQVEKIWQEKSWRRNALKLLNLIPHGED